MKSNQLFRLAQRMDAVARYSKSKLVGTLNLRLDSNESAAPDIQICINGEPLPSSLLNRYPDDTELRQELADKFGLALEEVAITAGADDALDRICRTLLEPGRNMVLPVPTFEMIERYVSLAGGSCKEVPWLDSVFPLEDVLAAVDNFTVAICMVTPNNPTGSVASFADIQRISQAAPQCVLILDQAYAEFCSESFPDELWQIPNLIITRTFSKAWGLAGLRVGYALAAKPLIDALQAAGSPYSVSSLSLEIAQRQLQTDREAMLSRVVETEKIKARITQKLRQLDCDPKPSRANFVWAKVPDPSWLRDGLAGLGIAVRAFGDRPHLTGSIRIGCPSSIADMDRLERSLDAVLKPQALLFDMDGVLADVSTSFRVAVEMTCLNFGVVTNQQEIEKLKRRGGFNNDWVLTQAILQENGIEASIAEIRTLFDGHYKGQPDESNSASSLGLRQRESLLVSREILAGFANRFKLAIVTGRPRCDAQYFLEQFSLLEFFSVVICLEDAPSKPAPDAVELALQSLGVDRAWMIGDTVDDIRAARAAGVVPIGVIAPGQDPFASERVLMAAGAARVLSNAAQMLELLR
jgi:histidinol-phosphate aminotransferase